jgi:hypothetical protein
VAYPLRLLQRVGSFLLGLSFLMPHGFLFLV